MSDSDFVINNWYQDIENFYYFLRNLIGEKIDLINKDNNCLSLSLRKSDYLTRYQKCQGCQKTASFLNDDTLDDIDEFEINFGKKKGEKIIFNRYDYQNFSIEYYNQHKKINLYINQQINKFINDFHHPDNYFYYGSRNKFLNLAIINIIMKTIAKAKNFPTPVKFLNFYICREKINILSFKYEVEHLKELLENPSLTSHLSPTARKKKNSFLTVNIVEDIWKQIIIFFLFYEKFYFCHNQASIEFIKFNYEINNFTFLDKEYISSIKLYILPSVYSNISIYHSEKDKWARFCYYKKENREYTNLVENWFVDWDGIVKKNKKIFIHSLDDFENGKIMYYLLGKEGDKFLYFRRHLGANIMYQSFDIACFLVSLMVENYFYHTVKNNKRLNKIWSGLWLEEELNYMEKEIQECKKNDFDHVFAILRKYYIRCDIIEYLYYKLL